MALTEEEKAKRDRATREITTFDAVGEDDYVFISYKSDDWEIALDRVVRYMVENYGLRVYFDKNFARDNDSWVKNMTNAITTRKCRAVLAFVSRKYMVSCACMMELLTARSKLAQMNYDDGNRQKLPIIPIIIDHSDSVRGAMGKAGKLVSVKEWTEYVNILKNTKASPWVDESGKLYSWLDSLIGGLELTEERVSLIAENILREGHERTFTEKSYETGFFDDLKEAIENCSQSVFDPGLIKKKTAGQADADGAPKADGASKASAEASPVKTEKKEKPEPVSLPRELYPELKIGRLVQQVLRPLLEEKASEEEIRQMQEAEYSRKTFGINYPLLVKTSQPAEECRYYSTTINIRQEEYRLCSQWFETPANNDRPYVEKWIKEHQ